MYDLTEEERHYEKYIDVAMQLLTTHKEVSPSARALIERVGGSMTTANKAMQVFWGYVGKRLSYDQQYPDGMPLELIKLMEKTMAIARESAKKELQSEWMKVAEHARKLEQNRVTLEQSMECLSQEIDGHKKHIDTVQRELESLKQQLIATKSKNDLLALENTAASTKLSGAEIELSGTKTELSSLKRELENLSERLKESNERQHSLLNEIKEKNERIIAIERQNQTLTEHVNHHTQKEIEYKIEHKKELDQFRKKIEGLENQNSTNQEILNEKNTALIRMEIEARESKRHHLKLEADLQVHIKHHSHLEDQRAHLEHQLSHIGAELLELRPLKVRLSEIMGQVSDLRGERDRLIQLLDEKTAKRKLRQKRARVGTVS